MEFRRYGMAATAALLILSGCDNSNDDQAEAPTEAAPVEAKISTDPADNRPPPLEPEELGQETLSETPGAHYVWLNDMSFERMLDGRSYLVDADSGAFLGMIQGGYGHVGLLLPKAGETFHVPEIHYSRGTRGTRTDVVTAYDFSTLTPTGEVEIAPKRFGGIPMDSHFALTDDDRFAVLYNFTPAQSVSVVDLENGVNSGEFETAGCALIYPSGSRHFNMLCGDGSFLTVELNEAGSVISRTDNEPFFDPDEDPVTEKAVRANGTWYFPSYGSMIYEVAAEGSTLAYEEPWSLTTDEERAAGWAVGGGQPMAAHAATGRLYALMNNLGGPAPHKNPGTEIWVYDMATRTKVQTISLDEMKLSIAVSSDDAPLLYVTMVGDPSLYVYDAISGEHLRDINVHGMTLLYIQPAAR